MPRTKAPVKKPVARKAPATKKATVKKVPHLDTDSLLDDIQQEVGLVSTLTSHTKRVSTGALSLDLILSGGIVPGGWYTFFGGEQSSKSTLAMTQIAQAAIKRQKDLNEGKEAPIIAYFDYEGSFSPDYFLSIARSLGFKGTLQDMFGVQDEKGNFIKKGLVRRFQLSIGEVFFSFQRKLQNALPDKMYRQGKWWKVYESKLTDKKGKSKVVNEHLKQYADAKLFKETKKYWIECEDGSPQAILVVDSYPAMLPKNIADREDDSEAIAEQARMFSTQLKRVKGAMTSKKVIVMGVNQLRKVPMAMYGPSETEPSGEALRFYSDARLKMTSRSSVFGIKGKEEREESVQFKGKKDTYRYVNVKTIKNKLSVPDLETWLRIWVRDGQGEAHGYDPVFDSWFFMTQTGVATGNRNKMTLDLAKIGVKDWPKKMKPISFIEMKTLILGNKEEITKTLKKIGHKGKPFHLRKKLIAYMESGQAVKDYFDVLKDS